MVGRLLGIPVSIFQHLVCIPQAAHIDNSECGCLHKNTTMDRTICGPMQAWCVDCGRLVSQQDHWRNIENRIAKLEELNAAHSV